MITIHIYKIETVTKKSQLNYMRQSEKETLYWTAVVFVFFMFLKSG